MLARGKRSSIFVGSIVDEEKNSFITLTSLANVIKLFYCITDEEAKLAKAFAPGFSSLV
jgi:hypothetical protein